MENRINMCKVCKLNAGEGHTCQECQEIVHLSCGKGVGEEGYDQFVICNICQSIEERKVSCPQQGETFEINSEKIVLIPKEVWETFPQNGT